MSAFQELEVVTDPVFIPPALPECATNRLFMAAPMAASLESADVEVFASGEVGPYGFDVIGSEDPDALIAWLRDNNYRVTEEMEPLIDVYVEEEAAFLAMRLLPEQGAEDVQPVKITYASDRPMIPLRLTAVAANTDMAVMTWFYAEHQAVPVNYSSIKIDDTELIFNSFGGGSNYRQLMGDKADEQGGHGFITEYAMPTSELSVGHPLLQELNSRYPYITRLNTLISPEEMTIDPVFDYDAELDDVSNIHDLSDMKGLFDCEREEGGNTRASIIGSITSSLFGQGSSNSSSPSEIRPAAPSANSVPANPVTETTNPSANGDNLTTT